MKIFDIISEGLEDPKDNPCWKGYKPVGTKKKGGKTVPNCVPKESVAEMRDRRDSYQRDYDSSTGFGRPHDHRGLEQELAHETNNYSVSINGKSWKVFATKSHAEAVARKIQMKDPSKKVSVHETGAPVSESATAGATSSASIGTVPNPHISPGKARGKKSYTGTPGHSGTKAPPQPKVVQPKTSAGTAVNGLDIKGASLFGGPPQKR